MGVKGSSTGAQSTPTPKESHRGHGLLAMSRRRRVAVSRTAAGHRGNVGRNQPWHWFFGCGFISLFPPLFFWIFFPIVLIDCFLRFFERPLGAPVALGARLRRSVLHTPATFSNLTNMGPSQGEYKVSYPGTFSKGGVASAGVVSGCSGRWRSASVKRLLAQRPRATHDAWPLMGSRGHSREKPDANGCCTMVASNGPTLSNRHSLKAEYPV